MKKSLLPILVFWLAAPGASPPARAQAAHPPPTFGTAIEMINLNVSVSDGHHDYVSGLGRDDFAVFEDGVPQDLAVFERDSVPISLVLMIDASGSMRDKVRLAQQAAIRLTRTLQPEDQAEVVEFADRAVTLQPFTSDRAALEAAIRRTGVSGQTALHTALYVTLKELLRERRGERRRRRAIVLLTDGEDTASAVSDEQVLELARKSDVNVYAISLRPDSPADRARPAWAQAEYLLGALARDTGGQAYFPTTLHQLDAVYDGIARELRTLYTVGYASSSGRHDGKWRRIVVRLLHREGLVVRHKLGYYPSGS